MIVCVEMEREDICGNIAQSQNIYVYKDGAEKTFSKGDSEFEKIMLCWDGTVNGSHQMPAFGVSLNNKTSEALQKGVWLEFDFGEQHTCCGMPFDKLLIEVNPQFQGFNIIRYTKSRGYDGRCYYIDLVGKDMRELYNLLLDI